MPLAPRPALVRRDISRARRPGSSEKTVTTVLCILKSRLHAYGGWEESAHRLIVKKGTPRAWRPSQSEVNHPPHKGVAMVGVYPGVAPGRCVFSE